MGKGDKKSRRGKIIMGSYGVRRKKRTTAQSRPVTEIKETKPVKAVKEKAAPKAKAEKEELVPIAAEETAQVAETPKPAKKKAPPKASAKKEEKAAE